MRPFHLVGLAAVLVATLGVVLSRDATADDAKPAARVVVMKRIGFNSQGGIVDPQEMSIGTIDLVHQNGVWTRDIFGTNPQYPMKGTRPLCQVKRADRAQLFALH